MLLPGAALVSFKVAQAHFCGVLWPCWGFICWCGSYTGSNQQLVWMYWMEAWTSNFSTLQVEDLIWGWKCFSRSQNENKCSKQQKAIQRMGHCENCLPLPCSSYILPKCFETQFLCFSWVARWTQTVFSGKLRTAFRWDERSLVEIFLLSPLSHTEDFYLPMCHEGCCSTSGQKLRHLYILSLFSIYIYSVP